MAAATDYRTASDASPFPAAELAMMAYGRATANPIMAAAAIMAQACSRVCRNSPGLCFSRLGH